jgi:hypothetical protein
MGDILYFDRKVKIAVWILLFITIFTIALYKSEMTGAVVTNMFEALAK